MEPDDLAAIVDDQRTLLAHGLLRRDEDVPRRCALRSNLDRHGRWPEVGPRDQVLEFGARSRLARATAPAGSNREACQCARRSFPQRAPPFRPEIKRGRPLRAADSIPGRRIGGSDNVFALARAQRALIFDLDGTLVDTVYAHVFAWQRAFAEMELPIDGWRIHRRVGMSGGLFARAAAREIGRPLSPEESDALQRRHGELYRELLPERRPLPGAVELLAELRAEGIVHGIATSGRRPEIDASLEALGVGEETVVVERGDVSRAKPEPDLFLTCAERLGVAPIDCYVVGDAVWDLLAARRAGMLSVGLLSGGYGEDELTRAGAFRVYRDAAELRGSLDEIGVLT